MEEESKRWAWIPDFCLLLCDPFLPVSLSFLSFRLSWNGLISHQWSELIAWKFLKLEWCCPPSHLNPGSTFSSYYSILSLLLFAAYVLLFPWILKHMDNIHQSPSSDLDFFLITIQHFQILTTAHKNTSFSPVISSFILSHPLFFCFVSATMKKKTWKFVIITSAWRPCL